MTINTKSVKKDTIWQGNNFIQFKVIKVVKKGDKIWVHYVKENEPLQKYSCYQAAFIQRFHQLENIH